MAEKTGAALGQLPLVLVRPKRGKFAAQKSRAHAGLGVVSRDGIATDEPKQLAAGKCVTKPVRLDGDEQFRAFGNDAQQFRQPRILKMVQEQIGDDNLRRDLRPVKNVRDDGFGAPAERRESGERLRRHDVLAVEQNRVHVCPMRRNLFCDAQQKIPVARAEFGDLFQRKAAQIIF